MFSLMFMKMVSVKRELYSGVAQNSGDGGAPGLGREGSPGFQLDGPRAMLARLSPLYRQVPD